MFTFLVEQSRMVETIMAKLKKYYDLTGGKDLQWFLRMKIIQDQYKGYTALIQRVHLK